MPDIYRAPERCKALTIVTLLPYLNPALGFVVGGMVTQLVHWRWMFWIMSIAGTLNLLLGLVVIRETYAPVLLRRKAKEKGTEVRRKSHLKIALLRPVHILLHRPIIWLICWSLCCRLARIASSHRRTRRCGPNDIIRPS